MLIGIALVVFWFSLALVLHTYVLFPAIIQQIAKHRKKTHLRAYDDNTTGFEVPPLTILIAAYNEEKFLAKRLDNIIQQSYPAEKLRVLVGSDGSTDATNTILQQYMAGHPFIEAVLFSSNRGKAPVLNDLVARAETEILVFTDADVIFESNALVSIVRDFLFADVGAVAGTRINASLGGDPSSIHAEEHAYLSYDNRIRWAEGLCGTLIGAHGCFFAIRKQLFKPLNVDTGYTDDFYYSMLPFESGYRVTNPKDAIVYSEAASSSEEDFQRKVRYSSTAFATLSRFRSLLFDRRLVLSYCFWSHRVSKWFLPVFFILEIGANSVLICEHPVYFGFFILQLLFLGLCIVVWLVKRRFPTIHMPRLLNFSYYFVSSNIALLFGLFRFIRGGNSTRWTPQR